jgi:hypothetical protein
MTKATLITATLVLTLASSAAMAQERGGDAALGALSGAVVFGPVGAVAGAVVGYTAGPSIAHSLGFRRSAAAHRNRSVRQARASVDRRAPPMRQAAVPASTTPASPPPPVASKAPPVQGLE